MREYGRVHTSFWSSGTIAALSEDARLLALYLLTSPHSTLIGAFRLPDGYVCEDLNWDVDRFHRALAETVSQRFANRCETTKWVWIRQHLAWNPPENPNQVKAARKCAEAIPDECAWKAEFSSTYADLLKTAPEPFRNRSGTVSKQQDQKQKQKQDQEQEDVPPARDPAAAVPSAGGADATDPRPPDAPATVVAAWCAGYEHATGQPAMLAPGRTDAHARQAADYLTRADAWADLEALIALFLAAEEFAEKRRLGMFVANLDALVAWYRTQGPDVPYGARASRLRPKTATWRDACPHAPPCSTPTQCELRQARATRGAA